MSREKATAFILEIVELLVPGTPNTELVSKRLKRLTDEEFGQLLDLFEKGDDYIQIILPPSMTNKLTMENIEATAGRVGVKLFQRLWLTDQTTGLVSLTPKPALMMVMPDRRQSQTRLKKSSNAHDNTHIDELTGQPTGDSKASSISNPQMLILLSRALNNSMEEFAKVRGGDNKAFNYSNKIIHERGSVTLEEIRSLGTRAKSNDTLSAYWTAQHLGNNL